MTMLAMWTVYDHPPDYPDKFIARRFEVDRDGPRVTPSIIIADDLDKLRHALCFEMGLTVLTRSPEDDPCIVETWL
jgi:hypothetical protein